MSTVTTSLEAKHHHSALSTSTTVTANRTVARNSEGAKPSHPSIALMDRDSAIALGVIFVLVLAAIAWYIQMCIKTRRQADEERQPASDRQGSIGRKHTPGLYGARTRAADSSVHMDSLWPRNTRQDSVSTLTGSTSTEHKSEKEPLWSEARSLTCTMATTRVWGGEESDTTNATEQDGYYDPAQDQATCRSPSPQSLSGERPPPQSLSSPARSCHRRQSSVHDIPDPLLTELQLCRPSSQPPRQYDMPWWTEAARRGSTTHTDRRFSVLEPIPELGMVDRMAQHQQRRRSETRWREHESQRAVGSRSDYDWTQPSGVASGSMYHGFDHGRSTKLHEFNRIVWDDHSKQRLDEDGTINQLETNTESEGIESVDWATGAQDNLGPARQ